MWQTMKCCRQRREACKLVRWASRRRCLARDKDMSKVVTGLQSNPVTAHEINNNNTFPYFSLISSSLTELSRYFFSYIYEYSFSQTSLVVLPFFSIESSVDLEILVDSDSSSLFIPSASRIKPISSLILYSQLMFIFCTSPLIVLYSKQTCLYRVYKQVFISSQVYR